MIEQIEKLLNKYDLKVWLFVNQASSANELEYLPISIQIKVKQTSIEISCNETDTRYYHLGHTCSLFELLSGLAESFSEISNDSLYKSIMKIRVIQ